MPYYKTTAALHLYQLYVNVRQGWRETRKKRLEIKKMADTPA